MPLDSLPNVSRSLMGLSYTEVRLNWAQVEKNLTIVAPAERGLPDFYLTVPGHGRGKGLPMTRTAARQFGTLSGVKPGLYREFSHDSGLTEKMVEYSMGQRDVGEVVVGHTGEQIVGVYAANKPYFGLVETFEHLQTAPGLAYAEFRITPEGVFEYIVIGGRDKDSVRPGLYLAHGGRPVIAPFSMLHDFSSVLGNPKPPKRKKNKPACLTLLDQFVAAQMNSAIGEAEHIARLVGHTMDDPARFLSRLSTLEGFSSQAADTMLSGAVASLVAGSNQYEVTRYVAGLATATSSEGQQPKVDRRYQRFAHSVAHKGAGMCAHCGLPQ